MRGADSVSPAAAGRLGATWWTPLGAAVLVILLLAGWTIVREFELERRQAGMRLQSLAELRTTQVEAWSAQHLRKAEFLQESVAFAELFLRWRDESDLAARDALVARLVGLRQANDQDAVMVVDPEGGVLAAEKGFSTEVDAELRQAITQAAASGHLSQTGIYRSADPQMPLRLDLIVPLRLTGSPVRGLLVLRLNPRRSLFPMLASWPVPSATSESVLWRRDGAEWVSISDTRHSPDGAGRIRQPVDVSRLTGSQAILDGLGSDRPVLGRDYRGVEVLAVSRPVHGTDWWVVSKTDLSEVDAPSWRYAGWVLAIAACTLSGLWLTSRIRSQRLALEHAEAERQAQRERLQSLGLLEAFARSSTDGIVAKDLEGRYIFCNPAGATLLARAQETVVGRTDRELFEPDRAERMAREDAKVIASRSARDFEEICAPLPGMAGSRVLLSTRGPILDADGSVIGVFVLLRDVTRMRQAEKALRDSEAHYRAVVSALNEGILVTDPQGQALSCNPAAERIIGALPRSLPADGLLRPGWTFLRADDSEMPFAETPMAGVMAGGAAVRGVVMQMRDPSGQAAWFDVSSLPLTDPDDQHLIAVVTSFSDITERQRLEGELARHRDHLQGLVDERTEALQVANASLEQSVRLNRNITDTIPGRVAYWDAERRCRFANRVFCEFVRLPPEQVIGRTLEELMRDDVRQVVVPHFDAALQGSPQHFEHASAGPSGERVHQAHYLPDTDARGGVQGVFVMVSDITALKRAEVQLQRANEALSRSRDVAESASMAKSAFLANMSHEIRTPMNAIVGLTHLILRDIDDALQRQRLTRIDDAARHLMQVINDILDLSKIEAGKMTLEVVDFQLEEMLAGTLDLVSEQARAKDLELVLANEGAPAQLRGDPTRLSQALINLLSNAVKFTARGWVRLRVEPLRREGSRVLLRFEVSDTGEGIPQNQIDRLFAAFEQADNSITRRHGGTGLGLALTRHLAASMGGEVGVRSTLGEGSVFWLTAWLEEGREAGELAAPVAMKGLRALIVDDLDEARAVLGDRAAALGLQVDSVDSAAAALKCLQAGLSAGRPHDLLLIDWRMAPTDGIETLRRVRELLGVATPPSILVTAFDDPSMREAARQVSYDAVLLKPITGSRLHDALLRVLRRQSAPPAVDLQRAGRMEATESAASLLRRRHGGQRVLLAEDNAINQLVARELLEGVGLEVETAEDGMVALELAQLRPYDLILMDMQMPRLDGLSTTRELRRLRGRATPIVAMTANAFAEERATCLAAGMNDHVAKPVDPRLLYETLLRWLPLPERRLNGPGALEGSAAAGGGSLTERLSRLPGFDPSHALASLGQDEARLTRVLLRFVNLYRGGEPSLLEPLTAQTASQTLARWKATCHSMRGACSTVGAHDLLAAVGAMEAAMVSGPRDDASLADRARALHGQLIALVDDLQRVLEPER